jgi:hypothetical protein
MDPTQWVLLLDSVGGLNSRERVVAYIANGDDAPVADCAQNAIGRIARLAPAE